jgi:hypothetical protein
MVYCEYEKQPFPDSEFIRHNNGSIFRPHIHDVTPVHFAEGSVIIPPSQSPSSTQQSSFPSSRPPDSSRQGPVVSVKDIMSNEQGIVLLRAERVLQFLMAQDMPIEKLQTLMNYAKLE